MRREILNVTSLELAITTHRGSEAPRRGFQRLLGVSVSRCVVFSVLSMTNVPAFAQVELGGSYAIRMHEDYIERGPGSFLGDFTGMPLSDEGRAKALLYSSSLPSTIERQCLRSRRGSDSTGRSASGFGAKSMNRAASWRG